MRDENEAVSTAIGYPVEGGGPSGWGREKHEPNEEQRDRIAWNLPIPRRVSFPLGAEPVVPPGE